MSVRPRLLLTMGDVAGVGPEIVAKAWPELLRWGGSTVVGDPGWMQRGLEAARRHAQVAVVAGPADPEAATDVIPCWQPTNIDLRGVQPGRVSAAAGRAAYEFLCAGID